MTLTLFTAQPPLPPHVDTPVSQEYALVSSSLQWDGTSEPRLIVRKQDALNYVAVGPRMDGKLVIEEMEGGTKTQIGSAGTISAGVATRITADIYVDWIALRINGVPVGADYIHGAEPFVFRSAHDFAKRTQTGTTGSGWGEVKVADTDRVKLNWPRFHTLGTRSFPDVKLGAAGAWDSTDCNNPNVIRNPQGGWILSYTGYYNGGTAPGDEAQDMGIAHAATLDGPWTKDSRNPLFGDPNKWSMNGGFVWVDGVWFQCYGTGNSAKTVGIATSTDLVNWTVKSSPGPGHDSIARVRDDGTTVEVYCKQDNGAIWRYVTPDKGDTWKPVEKVVSAPSWYPSGTPSFAEPGIYVPPGQEGKQMIVTPDRSNSAGRYTMMGITVDGGATWQWATLQAGGARGQGDASRFDSFLVSDGKGGFYLYYCGSDSNTPTLNGGLQLGHRRIDWRPEDLVRA